ncbi:MAG: hypothetical protein ABSD20_15665, partial [Terriglobales bacterium]
SIGSAELQPGQSLITEQGKAEVLLTPGVFLRVGANSSVTMISPSITDTEVGLDRGHAMIEIAEIHPENDIRMRENGATVRMLKTGLYDFDGRQEQLRIFDGKALVQDGTQQVSVKDGREVSLAGNGSLKAQKFNKKSYEDGDLYRWSSLRSAYLAEANVDAAGAYAMNGWGPWGFGWWGTGWYWDPWFDAYTFLPGAGMFYSPFGWGFYSPWWVYRCPLYGYGYLHRYGYGYYDHYVHHFSGNARNWGPGPHYVDSHSYANGIYRGPGSSGGGFHSGPRTASLTHGFGGFGGGSSHGGGGGSHGGGGGHGR